MDYKQKRVRSVKLPQASWRSETTAFLRFWSFSHNSSQLKCKTVWAATYHRFRLSGARSRMWDIYWGHSAQVWQTPRLAIAYEHLHETWWAAGFCLQATQEFLQLLACNRPGEICKTAAGLLAFKKTAFLGFLSFSHLKYMTIWATTCPRFA